MSTYEINTANKSITCLICHRTSHHPKDIEYLFCNSCGFHPDLEPRLPDLQKTLSQIEWKNLKRRIDSKGFLQEPAAEIAERELEPPIRLTPDELIHCQHLPQLVMRLNYQAYELTEGHDLTLSPFMFHDDGTTCAITFMEQQLWTSEDGIEDLIPHLQKALGSLLTAITMLNTPALFELIDKYSHVN